MTHPHGPSVPGLRCRCVSAPKATHDIFGSLVNDRLSSSTVFPQCVDSLWAVLVAVAQGLGCAPVVKSDCSVFLAACDVSSPKL